LGTEYEIDLMMFLGKNPVTIRKITDGIKQINPPLVSIGLFDKLLLLQKTI
jgi:hypothetical protein